jgi:hypothetical protein
MSRITHLYGEDPRNNGGSITRKCCQNNEGDKGLRKTKLHDQESLVVVKKEGHSPAVRKSSPGRSHFIPWKIATATLSQGCLSASSSSIPGLSLVETFERRPESASRVSPTFPG